MASSWFSHIHNLLLVSSAEICRSDLGTTAISKIYFSKSEQVKVHVHCVSDISLCIAQKDVLTPMFVLHQFLSPKTVVSVRAKKGLYFVTGFEFGHSLGISSELHKDWTHLYSWQQSITALLARGVPHCPEMGKVLLFQLLLLLVPEKYQYTRPASIFMVSFITTPLHSHLFYVSLGLFRKQSGDQIWCSCPSVQSKMQDPMKTECQVCFSPVHFPKASNTSLITVSTQDRRAVSIAWQSHTLFFILLCAHPVYLFWTAYCFHFKSSCQLFSFGTFYCR